MAVGIGAISFFRAAINTSHSETVSMQWSTPEFIYACPVLQRFGVNSDEGRASCFITQFRNASFQYVTVSAAHLFIQNCTGVTFRLDVTDAQARIICRNDFF
jgi:hypothetical protein